MEDSPERRLAEVIEQGRGELAFRIQVARRNVNAFCEMVLRDEETGKRIEQAPLHIKWHKLADTHKRLVIWSHTEAGKTNQLVIGRALFELGLNPNARVAIIGNTREQASKIIRIIAKYIEHSQELKAIFPHLKRSENDSWTSTALFVERGTPAKDPSVQAFGVHGAIMGARIDKLILDDVLDYENCQTPKGRNDLWQWYHSSVSSRLTKDASVICVGTAWHPEDMLHRFADHPMWVAKKFPVLNDDNQPTWPTQWPRDRIEEQRIERGPLEFARTMMCKARDEGDSHFKKEYVDKALEAGEGWPTIYSMEDEGIEEDLLAYDAEWRLGGPEAIAVYTGVDLAVQKKDSADLTALATIGVMPNGDRRLYCVESGRWSGPEIISRIENTYERYGSIFYVEGNAAQDYIRQFAVAKTAIPIHSFVTGRNKHNPNFGVESIAAEMANGKWIIPNEGGVTDPEIRHLITEMLYYQPDAHTGDRLMALWFAREGARKGERKRGVGARIIG